MARNPVRIAARNKKIKEDFKAWSEKKSDKGRQKYKFDFIVEQLADKYWLDEITIERILVEPDTGETDGSMQGELELK